MLLSSFWVFELVFECRIGATPVLGFELVIECRTVDTLFGFLSSFVSVAPVRHSFRVLELVFQCRTVVTLALSF